MKERFAIWLAPQNGERREVAPLRPVGVGVSARLGVLRVLHQRHRRAERGCDPGCGRSCSWRVLRSLLDGAALFYAVLPLAASVATLAAIVGSPSRASARPQAIAPSSSSPPPLRPRALLSCSSPSPIRGLTLRSSASAPWPRASEAHFCGRCGASTTPSSPEIERNGSRRFPRYPPPSSCFWYPPWTVGCPLPSPRRCRFCPASVSISRGRQKPPAPKRRSQPPIASQPSSAPPWRGSGARGSASSSCSPS